MTNSEFYKNLTDTVKAGLEDIKGARAELKRAEQAISSGVYSAEYVTDTLRPQVAELRKRIEKTVIDTEKKAGAVIKEHAGEVRAGDMLNPAALTDDVKLLAPGIILKERDLVGMLERNEGNATMTQIILRYAEQNGFEDLGVRYSGNRSLADQIESMERTVGLVLRRAGESGVDMFERLLGDGSVAHTAFCM